MIFMYNEFTYIHLYTESRIGGGVGKQPIPSSSLHTVADLSWLGSSHIGPGIAVLLAAAPTPGSLQRIMFTALGCCLCTVGCTTWAAG